jgi:glutaredoxin-related protein
MDNPDPKQFEINDTIQKLKDINELIDMIKTMKIEEINNSIKKVLYIDYYKPLEYEYGICVNSKLNNIKILDSGIGKLISTYLQYNINLDQDNQLSELIIPIEHFILYNLYQNDIDQTNIKNYIIQNKKSYLKNSYNITGNIAGKITSISGNIAGNVSGNVSGNISGNIANNIMKEIKVGDVMDTNLMRFEKSLIMNTKNKKIDDRLNMIINILYNVNRDLKTNIDMKELDRIKKQKDELENVLAIMNSNENMDSTSIEQIKNGIESYNKKIKDIQNVKLDESQKSNILRQLKEINPQLDFVDIKESMNNFKSYIDQLELSINKITTDDKKDKLLAISVILILYRNMNEYISCF